MILHPLIQAPPRYLWSHHSRQGSRFGGCQKISGIDSRPARRGGAARPKELEKRGHRFVRYADDCKIYVRSQRAGERVLAGIEQFLAKRLKLKVNKAKSAVAAPRKRTLSRAHPA
jgi:hypothetical protein